MVFIMTRRAGGLEDRRAQALTSYDREEHPLAKDGGLRETCIESLSETLT